MRAVLRCSPPRRRRGWIVAKNFAALRAANEGGVLDRLAFWWCKSPRCPHCGESIDIENHELWRLYEEGEHELECPYCGSEFRVSVEVSYSFSTDDQDMDDVCAEDRSDG